MNAQPSSLRALLETTPVRKGTTIRSPVRLVFDDNFELFKELAERGYPHAEIAKSFILDFSHVRSARPDDDDEAYLAHVASTFSTFKRNLYRTGVLIKGKKPKPQKASAAPKVKAGTTPAELIQSPPVPTNEPVAIEPVSEAPIASIIKPTSGGYPIPKAKDF